MSHAAKPAGPVAGLQRPQRVGAPALIIVVCAAAAYLFVLAAPGYAAGLFAGAGVPEGTGQGPRAEVVTPGNPGHDEAHRSWSQPC